jgi:arginyl-tRNA synthetase
LTSGKLIRFCAAVLKITLHLLFDVFFFNSHSVNVALKCLPVKNQPLDVAQVRLATFIAAKRVLSQGMKILGIEPLQEM